MCQAKIESLRLETCRIYTETLEHLEDMIMHEHTRKKMWKNIPHAVLVQLMGDHIQEKKISETVLEFLISLCDDTHDSSMRSKRSKLSLVIC